MIYFGDSGMKMQALGVMQGKLCGLHHQVSVCYANRFPKSFEQLTGVNVPSTCSFSLFVSDPPLCNRVEAVVQCRVLCDNSIACAAPIVEHPRARAQNLVRRFQYPFPVLFSVFNVPHLLFLFVSSLYRCARKKNFGVGLLRVKLFAWVNRSSFSILIQKRLTRIGLTLANRCAFLLSRYTLRLTNYSFCLIASTSRPRRPRRNLTRAIIWPFSTSIQNAAR